MFDRGWRFYLDEGAGGGQQPAGGQQQTGGQQQGQQTGQQPAATYDTWLASQSADVKSLVDGHIGGLKTALQSERERNKTLEKDLRDAASKAEKGSESEKRLTELANEAQEAGRKTAFYENAVAAGVTNLKLAYMAAKNDDLFRRDGSADFDAIKKGYPELFGARVSSNNGGSGTGGTAPTSTSMDDIIRGRAGVTANR